MPSQPKLFGKKKGKRAAVNFPPTSLDTESNKHADFAASKLCLFAVHMHKDKDLVINMEHLDER